MGKEENKIVFGIISIVLSSESAIITLSNLVEGAWWFTATFISWFSFVTVPMWTSLTTQVKGGLSRGLLLIWLSTGALTHPPWNLGSWEGRNVGGPEGCRSPISWRDRLVRFLRSLFLVSQRIQALPCGLRCQRRAESNSQVWVLDEYVSEAPVQSVWAKNQDIRNVFPGFPHFEEDGYRKGKKRIFINLATLGGKQYLFSQLLDHQVGVTFRQSPDWFGAWLAGSSQPQFSQLCFDWQF